MRKSTPPSRAARQLAGGGDCGRADRRRATTSPPRAAVADTPARRGGARARRARRERVARRAWRLLEVLKTPDRDAPRPFRFYFAGAMRTRTFTSDGMILPRALHSIPLHRLPGLMRTHTSTLPNPTSARARGGRGGARTARRTARCMRPRARWLLVVRVPTASADVTRRDAIVSTARHTPGMADHAMYGAAPPAALGAPLARAEQIDPWTSHAR